MSEDKDEVPKWKSKLKEARARQREALEKLFPQMKLQRLQREMLEDEREWNELLRPQTLRNMGLIEEVGEDGKKSLRAMTEEEKLAGMTDEEKSAYEVEQLIAARQEKAAKGELEIPSYVEDEIKRQQEQQNVALSQRLGARGARLSTPGISNRANMMATAAGTKNAYSYGNESTGLGLLNTTSNYLGNLASRNMNAYGGFTNAGVGLLPMASASMQPYTLGRQLQNERDLMEGQRQNAAVGGVLSGVGTAASMYFGGK